MTEPVVTTQAFVGKAFLLVGDGASPENFTRYCEVDNMSELGVKNDLVEATTFCSGGDKEYIPGLGDGAEFTFSGNYALENAQQESLIDDVDSKARRNFRLQMGDDSPVTRLFAFTLAMLQWGVTPSVQKQNQMKFVGKVTGPITRTLD
jgi:hypothetical protein